MRKKVSKKVPMPNAPGTYTVYYVDGTKGIEHVSAQEGDAMPIPDQGRTGKPATLNGQATEGEAATANDPNDEENLMGSMRTDGKDIREEYFRDQRFRDYSDTMADIEFMPETPETEAKFQEAAKKFPEYIKPTGPNDHWIEGYFLNDFDKRSEAAGWHLEPKKKEGK